VTTATADQEYGKLTYESQDQACEAHWALVSTTRMAAGRLRPGGSLWLIVSKALPLTGPQEVLPQRLRYPRHMSGARNSAVRPAVQPSVPWALEVLPQRLRNLGSGATAFACLRGGQKGPTIPDVGLGGAGNASHTRSVTRRHRQATRTEAWAPRTRIRSALRLGARDLFRTNGLRPSQTSKRCQSRPAGPKFIQK
jgi:hypothetical protein